MLSLILTAALPSFDYVDDTTGVHIFGSMEPTQNKQGTISTSCWYDPAIRNSKIWIRTEVNQTKNQLVTLRTTRVTYYLGSRPKFLCSTYGWQMWDDAPLTSWIFNSATAMTMPNRKIYRLNFPDCDALFRAAGNVDTYNAFVKQNYAQNMRSLQQMEVQNKFARQAFKYVPELNNGLSSLVQVAETALASPTLSGLRVIQNSNIPPFYNKSVQTLTQTQIKSMMENPNYVMVNSNTAIPAVPAQVLDIWRCGLGVVTCIAGSTLFCGSIFAAFATGGVATGAAILGAASGYALGQGGWNLAMCECFKEKTTGWAAMCNG